MDTSNLLTKFNRIGARLKVAAGRPSNRRRVASGAITLDVREDKDGEYFEVVKSPAADPEVAVLDVQPTDRHLLLLVREGAEKQKFLCGHDERHWFVAAIPETAPVGTVLQAKEALKPSAVRAAQGREGLRAEARNRRKNAAYRRQGEWFFLPVKAMQVDEKLVLRNERLSRGNGGKPHWVDFCYRTGGETVYVCRRHSSGVTEREYHQIITANPNAISWGWRTMRRNMQVFVRGRVRHADHRTIVLQGWHAVLMNTEAQAKAMRNVAFLD
jgi:hypothetical protein